MLLHSAYKHHHTLLERSRHSSSTPLEAVQIYEGVVYEGGADVPDTTASYVAVVHEGGVYSELSLD
jgi:hypothetical protein